MIETKRLSLVPLTPEQLSMLVDNLHELEESISCRYQAQMPDGEFGEIIKVQADVAAKDPENYIFHTFWLIIRKSDNVAVGSFCIKNLPDENGEVEIGYGLGSDFEGNGYVTEAIKALCKWLMARDDIKGIIADTEFENIKSQNVLERCGFKVFGETLETFWWRLEI